MSNSLRPHELQHTRPPCGYYKILTIVSLCYTVGSCCSSIWYIVVCIWEGNGTPLQYSCLENPMDGGAWWAVVHGVTKSRTSLSNFTFPFHFHTLEKEMATHSSVLAWRTAGTGKPGGLPSMGSHRVGHDWGDLAAAAVCICKSQAVIIALPHYKTAFRRWALGPQTSERVVLQHLHSSCYWTKRKQTHSVLGPRQAGRFPLRVARGVV